MVETTHFMASIRVAKLLPRRSGHGTLAAKATPRCPDYGTHAHGTLCGVSTAGLAKYAPTSQPTAILCIRSKLDPQYDIPVTVSSSWYSRLRSILPGPSWESVGYSGKPMNCQLCPASCSPLYRTHATMFVIWYFCRCILSHAMLYRYFIELRLSR